jgi:cancer susceptibility candidate protein 1
MQCDGTPDPTILPEINTFITLWHDEQQRIDMEYTMKQTNLVLALIKELNKVMNSIPNGSSEVEKIPTYKKVSILFQKKKEFFNRFLFRQFTNLKILYN